MIFEILTSSGQRFRFDDPAYQWQYALISGTIDQDDRSVVEILRVNDEDESEIELTITDVIAAGSVEAFTFLSPYTEKIGAVCGRCGFVTYED